MGLGGGSSDAAAVLRGLNRLWRLDYDSDTLERVAARVGSDVPFFLHGGTALTRGRGELVEPLPDHEPLDFSIFVADVEIDDKTRRMYAALTPADFSDGHHTEVTAATLRRNLPLTETDMLNAFDARIVEVAPTLAHAMATCRAAGFGVHAAGSGPGFYSWTPLAELPRLLLRELDQEWGVRALACRSLSREASLATREI
jgi:4-diphosphocytidyl-2-C-methyl-D-erythritol kinase